MKMMTKLGTLGTLLFMAVSANAAMIQAGYTVNTNQDSGLIVNAEDIADNPFQFNLNSGEHKTFKLFDIYTPEGTVNRDDLEPQRISVDFDFLLPASGSATANGETAGQRIFFGIVQKGRVSWDEPASFSFGPNNDGEIQIALSDAVFNTGAFGLFPGDCFGAAIDATVSLISDATPGVPTDVPEPNAAALFALALLGMGFMTYRRKSRI